MFDFFKKKEETKVDEFDIICPRCMLRMDKKTHGEIILDVCKTCGGTWFDKDEIEKLFSKMLDEETKLKKSKEPFEKDEVIKKILPKKARVKKKK